MSNSEVFKPTEEWPLQEPYKRNLHEQIQKWGEYVLPIIIDSEDEDSKDRETFFVWLIESVRRGDQSTARLIQTLEGAMLESTRSWYSGKLGSLSEQSKAIKIQNDFNTLYAIYCAGIQSLDSTLDS